MSRIKAVNWALAWRRSSWTVIWAVMMGLLIIMCLDLAAKQPVIFGIVMLAAVVGSIGLAHMVISWKKGEYGMALAALVLSVLAISTHAFMEASYWSSIIDQINQEVSAERAVNDARAAVAEKRKERYVTSSNGKSAGQVEAEIKAAEQNVLWTRSASCTNATAKESREFCENYWQMHSKLAGAREAGQLESVIWSAGTTVEGTTKRNLAAIALTAANLLGGNAEQYTAIIVITLVAFTQALLALALVLGWAPERLAEALTAPKDDPVSLVGGGRFPATHAPRTPLPHPAEKITGVKALGVPVQAIGDIEEKQAIAASSSEIPNNSIGQISPNSEPDPDDGTPAAKPEPDAIPEPDDTRKVVNLFPNDSTPPEAPRTKKKAKKEGEVKSWLAEATTQTDSTHVLSTAKECRSSYIAWCDAKGLHPVHQKVMSRQLGVLLGRKTGKGAKRDKNGSVFPGLLINPIVAQRARRYA
jgi:hypothetical protein